MSDHEEVEQTSQNNVEIVENTENTENTEHREVDEILEKVEKPFEKRTYKTKHETAKESKQRAIDNFKRGVVDPEYKVVLMSNGKFRCYPRKEPLPPDPIKLNQVAENKRSSEIVNSVDNVDNVKSKSKQHDPFSDIVYYNMTNQISEQLNKRLDAVNLELERLRHKNSKLKGKYKQLKQAIYITEEEDDHEEIKQQDTIEHHEPEQIVEPKQQFQNVESPVIRPTRRTQAINFNRFFN